MDDGRSFSFPGGFDDESWSAPVSFRAPTIDIPDGHVWYRCRCGHEMTTPTGEPALCPCGQGFCEPLAYFDGSP